MLTEENIEWGMVGGLAFISNIESYLVLTMLAVFLKMFISKYTYFHFDTEVVKVVSLKIISQ